jgi:hypothetical protein
MPRRKVGISHFPLSAEARRQEKVRPPKAEQRTSGGKSGHRLSREQGGPAVSGSDASFRGTGRKSGKSRGARAGLLRAGRKSRNRSARRPSR